MFPQFDIPQPCLQIFQRWCEVIHFFNRVFHSFYVNLGNYPVYKPDCAMEVLLRSEFVSARSRFEKTGADCITFPGQDKNTNIMVTKGYGVFD